MFLGKCDSKGVGGVGVFVNTTLAMNIESFEQLTTRIGRLRLKQCGSTPALTIFVVYAPTSSYDEGEIEAFYMDLEKFYKTEQAFNKVIVGNFNAKVQSSSESVHHGNEDRSWELTIQKPPSSVRTWESASGECHNEIDHIIVNQRFCLMDVGVVPKLYTKSYHRLLRRRFFFTHKGEEAAKLKNRGHKTIINWDLFIVGRFLKDSIIDNIDEEYDRLIQHLHDCLRKPRV